MTSHARFVERLTRSPEETRTQHLREWAEAIPGTTRIGDMTARCRAKVAGVVTNLRIDPRRGSGSVEATISDGSGQMAARWLGRSSLQGVRLGAGLVIEGIAGCSDEGELEILNPEYDLLAGPEHG